jgi:SAM-dependent methyltransferase
MSESTQDPVNQVILDIKKEQGIASLGLHSNKQWHEDPKHLMFSMARYKFVSKMLAGKNKVAEVGCGDGFNARIVLQEVNELALFDIDPLFVENANENCKAPWHCDTAVHDITLEPLAEQYDACYSLDVLEHIDSSVENKVIKHYRDSIKDNGVLLIGIPSLESQQYSKPASVSGHINCKSGNEFKATLEKYFHNVFLFSMNDEVIHTGYVKLAHYLFCICTNKR